jgi:hypothetical protein
MFQQTNTSPNTAHTQNQYIQSQCDDSINIQTVYTATTQKFVGIAYLLHGAESFLRS